MKRKAFLAVALGLTAISLLSATGCQTSFGPRFGVFSIPIPVSTYFQYKPEEKFWNRERYDKMPILGPLTPGAPEIAMDPPSDDEVMQKLKKARPIDGGFPFLNQTQWDNVRIVIEPISDYIDREPRVLPLIGPVQIHHAHYRCTVYFTETTHVGWPFPHTLRNEDAREVIYIDRDHAHMVGNVDAGGPVLAP